MRTLKKTLCLVLCLAMMAGLCVFASADFKDQDKIENEEAVAVLTGIGVIQGDDKGNFNPEGTLTRAEATVIITKLLGAADIKASTDKFTDVKADFWGMPFIAYCVAEGVVAGMGDGTFAPNAKLTGYQWATLLLRAIGYKIEGESWQIDVAKLVKSLGLAEGMTFNGVNEITRQDACQMALNALFTQTVHYEGGSKVTVGGVEIVTDSKLVKETDGKGNPVTLASTYFPKLEKQTEKLSTDDFGRPTTVQYKLGKKVLYKKTAEAVGVYVNEFSTKTIKALKGYKGFDKAEIIYNGGDAGLKLADLSVGATPVNGYTVELYADAEKNITTIVVTEGYLALVGKTTAANPKKETPASVELTVYEVGGQPNGKTITVTDDPDVAGDLFDVLAGYNKGDYVEVFCNPGWDTTGADAIIAVESVTAVSGKITKLVKGTHNTTSKLSIAGDQYALNNEAINLTAKKTIGSSINSELKVGAEGTVYVDANGCVLGYKEKSAGDTVTELFYAVAVYTKTEDTAFDTVSKYYIQGVDASGKEVIYQITKATYDEFGGNTGSVGTKQFGLYAASVAEATDSNNGDLKAEYATLKTITKSNTEDAVNDAINVKSSDIKVAPGYYYASGVKFIYVSGSKGNLTVTIKTGAQTVKSSDAWYYGTKSKTAANYDVSVVFIPGKASGEVTSADIVYGAETAPSASTTLDETGKPAYIHNVYINGVETEVITKSDAPISGFKTYSVNSETGLYTFTDYKTNVWEGKITNNYNGKISFSGVPEVTDVDVSEATIINVSGNSEADGLTAADLDTTETVTFVLNTAKNTAALVFITGSAR